MKHNNLSIIEVPEREEGEQGIKNLFEEIMTDNVCIYLCNLKANHKVSGPETWYPQGHCFHALVPHRAPGGGQMLCVQTWDFLPAEQPEVISLSL